MAELAGRLVLEGSLSCGLTHSLDARVAELRSTKRTPIYCGDWELKVLAVPREEQSFEEFVAELQRQRAAASDGEDSEDDGGDGGGAVTAYTAGDTCPADSLWELANFGQLFWEGPEGWKLPRGEQSFRTRIWVDLDPRAGDAGVLEAREDAARALEAIPGSELPENEAPKAAHAARIKADLDLLEQLVAQRGSIGGTVIPDALQPIVECDNVYNDGNDRTATFATANYCFHIHMSTS